MKHLHFASGLLSLSRRHCAAGFLFAFSLAAAFAQTTPTTDSFPSTLATGQELVRTYQGTRVSVRMVTSPYFGLNAAEWPTLELGPASLSFVRDNTGGAMVLLGDTLFPLPLAVMLEEGGRSRSPLEFVLSYDQVKSAAELQIGKQTYGVPVSGPAGPITLVLSAGATADWQLETVAVEVRPRSIVGPLNNGALPVERSPEPAAGPRRNTPALERAARVARMQEALADATRYAKAKDFDRAGEALMATSRRQRGTLEWQLESAGKLTHLALTLRQRYDYRGAIAAAQQALKVLRVAEQTARTADAKQQAAVHEMTAFLHDELLHDPAAARAEYEKAQQADAHSTRARRGLEALADTQARSLRLNGGR